MNQISQKVIVRYAINYLKTYSSYSTGRELLGNRIVSNLTGETAGHKLQTAGSLLHILGENISLRTTNERPKP